MVYRKPLPARSAIAIKMHDAGRAVDRADRAALQRRRAYFDLRGSFANEMVRDGEREMLAVDPASDLAVLGADGLTAWHAASQAAADMVDAIDAFLAAGGGSHAEFENIWQREVAAVALADDCIQQIGVRALKMKSQWLASAKEWARNDG